MPGPLSWYFHRLPARLHRVETAANHVTQLIVPMGLLLPQPAAGVAAVLVLVTQAWLVLSGNFAWLNWLTMLVAFSALDTSRVTAPRAYGAAPPWFLAVVCAAALLVLVLSRHPVRNLLSSRQRMNHAFDPLHLVNAYGAFGSVTRVRHEIVLEGTRDEKPDGDTVWRPYEFRGKPGDPARRPPQIAPYHLRLDWMMWFAALSPAYAADWFDAFVQRLLAHDRDTLRLLRHNPFPGEPPLRVRAQLYRYRFTTRTERAETGLWWRRTFVRAYLPPVRAARAGRPQAG